MNYGFNLLHLGMKRVSLTSLCKTNLNVHEHAFRLLPELYSVANDIEIRFSQRVENGFIIMISAELIQVGLK